MQILNFGFMSNAYVSVYLDKRYLKIDLTYPVKIRVTFNKKQVYYPTGKSITENKFNHIFQTGERLSKEDKEIKQFVQNIEQKAILITEKLDPFIWQNFEKKFLTSRSATLVISQAMKDYAIDLRGEERIGTAYTYECTQRSLDKFYPNATFIDFTPKVLRDYERYMLEQGRTSTTVGIYLRCLRSIFNSAIANGDLSQDYYPFGSEKKGKYEIPTGKNIKKALTIAEIKAIFNFSPNPGSMGERCLGYWKFMYLGNGLNCGDLARLKYSDVKGDNIEFIRQKTKRTKREVKPIEIPFTPQLKNIVKQFGTGLKTGYIFPILEASLSVERERQLVLQVIGVINDNMKKIAQELGITSSVSTMACRHSFSTILQQKGVPIAFISEALGHTTITTTQNYLKGFSSDAKKDVAQLLTEFD